MITREQLYAATNGGLDIIKRYYPQADEHKPFRLRDERTPSARMRKFGDVWQVTDFGDDGRAMSPIDIAMREENITFFQAVCKLAEYFGLTDESIRESNGAKITHRPAQDGEEPGAFLYEARELTEAELKVLGPAVRQKHCEAYGWQALAWYSVTKRRDDGQVATTTLSSTDTYPILMRTCRWRNGSTGAAGEFYKVYQPLAYDKARRFFYSGKKPKDYINGLFELEAAQKKYEDDTASAEEVFGNIESDAAPDTDNAPKTSKDFRLDEAVICAGERDALCAYAAGYRPIWFNSETYMLQESEYKQILKSAKMLYNVPDIDETGVRKGEELAMRFLDIHTVWLPEWLRTYRDNRGRPRKDLRDFVELRRDVADIKRLFSVAMPMKFWEDKWQKGNKHLEINSEFFINHLRHAGFATVEDKNVKAGTSGVRIDGCVVRPARFKDVRLYLRELMESRNLPIEVRNVITNSARIKADVFDNMYERLLDFSDFDMHRQFLFFKGSTWEVSADGVAVHRNVVNTGRYVWEDEIVEHEAKRTAPAFRISGDDGARRIEITDKSSCFFRFLINASRVFWREELENWVDTTYDNDDEREAYRQKYKFAIDGPLLSAEEKDEQAAHLINKIFAIGYLLHRYKSPSSAWCVFAMDWKMGDSIGDSNGRSGKSFAFKSLRSFMKTVTLNGRNLELTKSQFALERVSEYTDFLLIDDANKYFNFDYFFTAITGSIEVNPKGTKSYEIPFEKAPKIAITTNFTPKNTDSSTQARLLYTVFSDYYHQKNDENDYRESRSIRDDFGRDLFDAQYPEEMWNADINFMVDCLQFYLTTINTGVKINPPMARIVERTLMSVMGDDFYAWATTYFDIDGENVNRLVTKSDAISDFAHETNAKNITTQKFTKSLRAFCRRYGYRLNPTELLSGGRLIRKVNGKSTEMMYVQTTDELNVDVANASMAPF